ncbi:MAG: hypothetical protein ACLTJQ_06925 [Dialister invisus]|uniref:hypothetical protein n=1 Tax=Dialister invisus TaxID=218538 RepID=UPI003994EC78
MDTAKIKEQARAEKRTTTLTVRLTPAEKAAFQSYCDINDYDSSSLLRALMHEFLVNEQDTIKIHNNRQNRNSNNVTTNNYYTSKCDDK